MKTLIGMREFVLQRTNKKIERLEEYDYLNWRNNDLKEIENYANFLSRQPQLSDFVACGEDGLPLQKPNEHLENRTLYYQELEAYQQALDKVLFKGFEICRRNERMDCVYNKELDLHISTKFDKTLESLTPYNLELTDNAIKIIGV